MASSKVKTADAPSKDLIPHKVISGGWVDTRNEQFYPRNSVVSVTAVTAAKFRNALEPVPPNTPVTAGRPVSDERMTEEDLTQAPATAAQESSAEESAEPAPLPEGAEDATELFPNEGGASVYQMPDGSFIVRVPGREDTTVGDSDEVTELLSDLPAVEEEKPAPVVAPKKVKKAKK